MVEFTSHRGMSRLCHLLQPHRNWSTRVEFTSHRGMSWLCHLLQPHRNWSTMVEFTSHFSMSRPCCILPSHRNRSTRIESTALWHGLAVLRPAAPQEPVHQDQCHLPLLHGPAVLPLAAP